MKYTQADAAEALGVSTSLVENYERGIRRGTSQPVEIPRYIELACKALSLEKGSQPGGLFSLMPEVRVQAAWAQYWLSLPSFTTMNGKGRAFDTMHASMREMGEIPTDEPALLEMLFPMAPRNELRSLMFRLGNENADIDKTQSMESADDAE
jgi:transcriptional regulator with XRE-family HTH domain